MELVDRRSDASWLRITYAVSERRVCGLMTMAVSSYRYRTERSDEPLRARLVELAREKPRFGYRRLHVLLRVARPLISLAPPRKRVPRSSRSVRRAGTTNACTIEFAKIGFVAFLARSGAT